MCIRDSLVVGRRTVGVRDAEQRSIEVFEAEVGDAGDELGACLLYTSDAADERSSVDLGGRRIIKKKKINNIAECTRSLNKEHTSKHTEQKDNGDDKR